MTEVNTGKGGAKMPEEYPKHEQVVDLARRELQRGVHEIGGANRGPDVQKYQRATWLPGTAWPWCVAFWQWCTREAGLKMPYLGAGAYALYAWASKNGYATKSPMPGDAVIINMGSGHCAIYVRQEGNVVHTIDGNKGNAVRQGEYPRSIIRGFVHVPEKPTVAPAVVKPPVFEVVTSINGKSKIVYVSGGKAIGRKMGELLNRYGGVTVRRRKGIHKPAPAIG
jgi:hypothetical protein